MWHGEGRARPNLLDSKVKQTFSYRRMRAENQPVTNQRSDASKLQTNAQTLHCAQRRRAENPSLPKTPNSHCLPPLFSETEGMKTSVLITRSESSSLCILSSWLTWLLGRRVAWHQVFRSILILCNYHRILPDLPLCSTSSCFEVSWCEKKLCWLHASGVLRPNRALYTFFRTKKDLLLQIQFESEPPNTQTQQVKCWTAAAKRAFTPPHSLKSCFSLLLLTVLNPLVLSCQAQKQAVTAPLTLMLKTSQLS